jgi:hypothetical protein
MLRKVIVIHFEIIAWHDDKWEEKIFYFCEKISHALSLNAHLKKANLSPPCDSLAFRECRTGVSAVRWRVDSREWRKQQDHRLEYFKPTSRVYAPNDPYCAAGGSWTQWSENNGIWSRVYYSMTWTAGHALQLAYIVRYGASLSSTGLLYGTRNVGEMGRYFS